jgi:hypothetical protein
MLVKFTQHYMDDATSAGTNPLHVYSMIVWVGKRVTTIAVCTGSSAREIRHWQQAQHRLHLLVAASAGHADGEAPLTQSVAAHILVAGNWY